MTDKIIGSRHHARLKVVQALYQWDLAETPVEELQVAFLQEWVGSDQPLALFFNTLLLGTLEHMVVLDEHIEKAADRPTTDIHPVELAILRLAVYELVFEVSTPPSVVLNEALELVKSLGADEGYRFINGVLDQVLSVVGRSTA